jgi:hypothetical protein
MANDIPRRVIKQSLLEKGFVEITSKHHDQYVFEHNGRRYPHIRARISRGSGFKTYGIGLWSKMKKLLQLETNQQAYDLLTCPMNHQEYLALLEQNEQL